MSDQPILDYLKSRGQARPPMDLVASIADAVEGVPQQRHSWFAPFMSAAAAVAAAGVVVVAAILVGQDGFSAPPPGGSPTEGEIASPTSAPTVEPTPAPTLLRPGDSATIGAVDSTGRWGTVTLTRGDDLGGYDDGSVPADSFVVEIQVEYLAAREPVPFEFGAGDWTLVGGPDAEPIDGRVPAGGRREATRPSLATYPGAIDIFTNPLEGWLLFEVPRDFDDDALELVYRPAGFAEPVMVIPVREPGPAPAPVAAASPGPTPLPVTYVDRAEYPFSVIENAEADELFATPDTCTNPVDGYTITYPDAWFTNTEVGDWQPCTWFSPTFFDVLDDPNAVPPQVAIVIDIVGGTGLAAAYEMSINERIVHSRFEGQRFEPVAFVTPDGVRDPITPWYQYLGEIRDASGTRIGALTAVAEFEGAADYELNKAVLDRIMALIQFDE